MIRALALVAVGFFGGVWISNYRWLKAWSEVAAELDEQIVECEFEAGFADLDEWRQNF